LTNKTKTGRPPYSIEIKVNGLTEVGYTEDQVVNTLLNLKTHTNDVDRIEHELIIRESYRLSKLKFRSGPQVELKKFTSVN